MLEGGSLSNRLAGTPQPGRASAELVATLARAIHAAHQAGIVHRDLKPSNVLFTKDGTPKITDFGLAKLVEEESHQTVSGQLLGSPSYMAPEQARGNAREVGPAADVYALGAILYEMLTGRPPFKGTTRMETLRQVLDAEPVPPSRLVPKVPRDLETICLKCLAKAPSKRYARAALLADDLGRYLRGETIRARRTPLWERGLKWARRRPLAATLLVAVVGLVGATLYSLHHESERLAALRSESEDLLFEGRDGLARKDWAKGRLALSKLLTKIEAEPRLADLRARAADTLDQINRGLADQQAWEADRARYRQFLLRRNEALFHETQFTGLDLPSNRELTRKSARDALAVFAAAGPDGTWAPRPLPPVLTPPERAEVEEGCYVLLLILAEAMPQAEHGLKVLDQAVKWRPATRAYHLRRAACLSRLGDAAAAARAWRGRLPAAGHGLRPVPDRPGAVRTRPVGRGAPPLRRRAAAPTESFLGPVPLGHLLPPAPTAAGGQGRPERLPESGARLRLALPAARVRLGPGGGDLRPGGRGRGAGKQPPGQGGGSLRGRRGGLCQGPGVTRTQAGRGDSATCCWSTAALLRWQRRDLDRAVADLREAIRLDPRLYQAHAGLAEVLHQQGKADEAIEQFTQALALRPDLAALYRGRAEVYRGHEDLTPARIEAALHDLDEAVRRESPANPVLARDHTNRARLLERGGRHEEALAACDAALRAVPDHADAHRLRIGVLLVLKRYDDVIRSCDAVLKTRPTAEVFELRGLAKDRRKDFSGAHRRLHAGVGRASRPAGALEPPRLGLPHDQRGPLGPGGLRAALRLDASHGEALSGRGSARVLLGQHRTAVADAEESLRHGAADAWTYYLAGRIYARAALAAAGEVRQAGRAAAALTASYQDRAVTLIGEAVRRTPPGQQAAFVRDQVFTDPTLRPILRRLRFEGSIDHTAALTH